MLIGEVWILRKGTRGAGCTLWNHPLGWEMRCDVDGQMYQTKASRDINEVSDAAVQWRKAFEAKGWTT
jgi:hypothetical protein